MERDQFEQLLDHLNGIGNSDDHVAAEHGRAVLALLAAAGVTWDEILRRPADGGDSLADGYDHAAFDADIPDTASVRLALHRLLARDDLSAATRDDLESFVGEATAGELDADDARYVLALDGRLNGHPGR